MDPIVVPIQDSIDLHTFRPREVPGLLTDFFQACRQKDIYSVRVVHGKGRGILRQRVHALLNKHPLVAAYNRLNHYPVKALPNALRFSIVDMPAIPPT